MKFADCSGLTMILFIHQVLRFYPLVSLPCGDTAPSKRCFDYVKNIIHKIRDTARSILKKKKKLKNCLIKI